MEFVLRTWEREDAADLAQAANNLKIARKLRNVFPHPYSLEDAQWFIQDCMKKEGERQLARAIVLDRKAVGSISLTLGEDVYERSAELGYWLAEPYWGRGIMQRAVDLLCREAFARFPIVRIFAQPFADNAASRAVLEKAGFVCEGVMRNGVYKNGQILSYCMYARLREGVAP